tara:strand:- start:451 stop:1026 length:576 start_codon:yes stop_codon:yes gene_type:complete
MIKNLKIAFIGLFFSLSWNDHVSADMMSNDEKYLLNNNEYIEAIDRIEACCYQFYEGYKTKGGLVAKKNYRFPLKDGRELIMIMEDFGAHSYWYRLFISGPKTDLYMIELNVPPIYDISWYPYVFGERIFNPTFNLETEELVAWDFGGAGELLIRVTYQYVGGTGADFKLIKLEEDDIDDDLSEYNLQINY